MKRKISRREFMKGTVLVAASGVLAGCAEMLPSSSGPASGGTSGKDDDTGSSGDQGGTSDSGKQDSAGSSDGTEKKSAWNYKVTFEPGKTAELTGYNADHPQAPHGAVTIPSQVDGYTITSIGQNCFEKDQTITSVFIPKTVQTVGSKAFNKCKNLKKVVMEEGSVEKIEYYAFVDCSGLESVQFSSTLALIDTQAFLGCTALNDLVIPENSKGDRIQLKYCSFAGCTALVNVYLPKYLEKLDCPFSFPSTDKKVYYQGSKTEWKNLVSDKMDLVGDSKNVVEVYFNCESGDMGKLTRNPDLTM